MTRSLSIDEYLERVRAGISRLTPADAWDEAQRGARLVDIRPEFQRRHDGEIPGAIVIERNHLEWRLDPASDGRIPEAEDENVRWIVVCDEGYASSLAVATLRDIGLPNVSDVVGGIQAWKGANLPMSPPGHLTPPRRGGWPGE